MTHLVKWKSRINDIPLQKTKLLEGLNDKMTNFQNGQLKLPNCPNGQMVKLLNDHVCIPNFLMKNWSDGLNDH